jgi:tRNA threonylcarbamoyladenosine biosynthesis protein TsaB
LIKKKNKGNPMISNLNILCVDTSTEACSVALFSKKNNVTHIFDRFMIVPREHTTKILPSVEEVLAEAKIKLSDLDAIAYGRGPGSFTGVRIGISIAQGLAFGLEKKVIGISTLQAMAQKIYKKTLVKEVYCAIDARMGEVYFAHYQLNNDVMELLGEEVVIKPADLIEKMITVTEDAELVGTGWKAYPELMEYFSKGKRSIEIAYPDSKYMLEQAVAFYLEDKAILPENAQAVYLRDKVTWKKLPGRE